MTAATREKKIDPFKGVVNPDSLRDEMRKMAAGDWDAKSYVRGALKYLEKHPPNKYIVPLLRKAMERY